MTRKNPDTPSVAVIGAGPAGMLSAITSATNGVQTLLFEKNSRVGRKLGITGKGRCNLTNDCDRDTFLSNIPTNPRFLYASFANFSNADVKEFFEGLGVPLKVERGERVFPVSDRAGDIVSALEKECHRAGVKIIHEEVKKIAIENNRVTGLETESGFYPASAVVIATGGASYPLTGSTGDGYRFAREAGHTVADIHPSLVPLTSDSPLCALMQGLSLRNVAIKIVTCDTGRTVYEDFGEMLFTHFGVTGPVILSASAHLSDIAPKKYELQIDLKPALDEKKLNLRVLSDFEKYKNRDFINALSDLLPQKMIPAFVGICGIPEDKKVHSITKSERETIVKTLKCFRIPLSGVRPLREAIVTRGGVKVSEISPKTMESKLVHGLYFAGEVIDVDAYTGGFNLQIAFSTGHASGLGVAEQIREDFASDENDSNCN